MVEMRRICVFCGAPTDKHIAFCPHGKSFFAPEMQNWHRGYRDAMLRRPKAETDDASYLCGWERGCAIRKGPN